MEQPNNCKLIGICDEIDKIDGIDGFEIERVFPHRIRNIETMDLVPTKRFAKGVVAYFRLV